MVKSSVYKKASFGERFLAYIVDQFILLVIAGFITVFFSYMRSIIGLLFWVIPLLYNSICIAKFGGTPGKLLLKLRVTTDSYNHVPFGTAFLRESIGKIISGFVFDLGYIWMLIDRKNQTWHDKSFHTYVVKVNEKGKLIALPHEEAVTTARKVFFGIWIFCMAIPMFLIIGLVVAYTAFIKPVSIKGKAMEPSYKDGQYYIVNRQAYNSTHPSRGDVILYRSPEDPGIEFFQRVIGMPGETIAVKDGIVFINGKELDESRYLSEGMVTDPGVFLPEGKNVVIPANNYIVMGDNRAHSQDSRNQGFIGMSSVLGKFAFCYFRCTP